MPRRKDHTPEQLKSLISSAARNLIETKGLCGLTARAIAKAIGYTPGTIYNLYKDLDSLIMEVNYDTLEQLYTFCIHKVKKLPDDSLKIRALANAYIDFAFANKNAWEAVFRSNHSVAALPQKHEELLLKLFGLIESALQKLLETPQDKLYSTARLLWVYVHGITVIAVSGKLSTIGIVNMQEALDDLLDRYLLAQEL